MVGAFFMFGDHEQVSQNAVRAVFAEKGFGQPNCFLLGDLRLWLYPKQMLDKVDNYLIDEQQDGVFATGTVVYKGLGYRSSLRAALEDVKQGRLDMGALLGNFCLIFYVDGQIRIVSDRLCTHHVFADQARTRLSTSFLALLASFPQQQPLNQLAFYEKISTGYIVGPDTLVTSIQQLTPQLQRNTARTRFPFLAYPPVSPIVPCAHGFDACVDHQLGVLEEYFKSIHSLADECGVDLGLSGGYDSRLVFLLAKRALIPISVHTHHTDGVEFHDKDQQIVAEMAGVRNVQLRVVETRRMEEQGETEVARILHENLYYFDGRNSHNMGAFSEVYTPRYKARTMAGNRLSLNGLGGEIYRNYYFTSRRRFDFAQWMEHHVYYPFTYRALPNKRLRSDIHMHIVTKMAKRLQVALDGDVDLLTMRRYYSEVRMPDCDGNNHNAHNQLVFYLTPFIEHSIVREGLKATPYIGMSGRFQAAMLSRVDPAVAGINSHYGFPLTREPLSHVVRSLFKGYLPDSLWNARNRYRIQYRHLGGEELDAYLGLYGRSRTVQEIEEALRSFFPRVDWRAQMRDSASRATAMLVGTFLREFATMLTRP